MGEGVKEREEKREVDNGEERELTGRVFFK